MSEQARSKIVTYYETELHLTPSEYVALKIAALDDPVEADRIARVYLKREETDTP